MIFMAKSNKKALLELKNTFKLAATELTNSVAIDVHNRLKTAQKEMHSIINSWNHVSISGKGKSIYDSIILSSTPKAKKQPFAKSTKIPTRLFLRIAEPQIEKASALEYGVRPHWTSMSGKTALWARKNIGRVEERAGAFFASKDNKYIVFVGGDNSVIKKGQSERKFWTPGLRAAFPKGVDKDLEAIAEKGLKRQIYNLERKIRKINKR